MSSRTTKTCTFIWQGIEIELTHAPKWSRVESCKVSHLEIQSINPPNDPLPITRTGYLSHFFYPVREETLESLTGFVRDWLDREAKTNEWKLHVQQSRQLSLF